MLNAETIMLYAIPVFFLLIGIELLVGIWMERKFYRFSDALANISCGITQQVSGAILKLLGLGLYVFLYQHARIMDIPNNWFRLFQFSSTPNRFSIILLMTVVPSKNYFVKGLILIPILLLHFFFNLFFSWQFFLKKTL